MAITGPSTDGVYSDCPLAIRGGGRPDKSCMEGLVLMITSLSENHQPSHLMRLESDEMLGHI